MLCQSPLVLRRVSMCILKNYRIPRGWQKVCLRAKMAASSSDPCSLFLSPNGRTFTTMEQVHKYNSLLEKEKLLKEQRKMELKMKKNTAQPFQKAKSSLQVSNWSCT